jgi:hypothetical protein
MTIEPFSTTSHDNPGSRDTERPQPAQSPVRPAGRRPTPEVTLRASPGRRENDRLPLSPGRAPTLIETSSEQPDS